MKENELNSQLSEKRREEFIEFLKWKGFEIKYSMNMKEAIVAIKGEEIFIAEYQYGKEHLKFDPKYKKLVFRFLKRTKLGYVNDKKPEWKIKELATDKAERNRIWKLNRRKNK